MEEVRNGRIAKVRQKKAREQQGSDASDTVLGKKMWETGKQNQWRDYSRQSVHSPLSEKPEHCVDVPILTQEPVRTVLTEC